MESNRTKTASRGRTGWFFGMCRSSRWSFRSLQIAGFGLLSLGVPGILPPASAVCLDPPGDLDGSGLTTVVDVHCTILMALWALQASDAPPPSCVGVPGSPLVVVDHDCSGVLTVADAQIVIQFALHLPLSPAIDADGNLCADACESDLDGDGDEDFTDCSPTDASVNRYASEVCNGFDDDCDGLIDETTDASVAASCLDSNVCNGAEFCASTDYGDSLRITEWLSTPLAAAPPSAQWVEIFNPGGELVNINGWRLSNSYGQQHDINAGGALFVPPNGFVVLAGSTDYAVNGEVRAHYAFSNFTVPAAVGSLSLRNKTGALVTEVVFSSSAGVPFVPGASTALADFAAGTWSVSSQVFGKGDKGTPGGPNLDVAIDTCAAGDPLVCTDANPCTDAQCDPQTGCEFVFNSAPCDDGDECTAADTCELGQCVGVETTCGLEGVCTQTTAPDHFVEMTAPSAFYTNQPIPFVAGGTTFVAGAWDGFATWHRWTGSLFVAQPVPWPAELVGATISDIVQLVGGTVGILARVGSVYYLAHFDGTAMTHVVSLDSVLGNWPAKIAFSRTPAGAWWVAGGSKFAGWSLAHHQGGQWISEPPPLPITTDAVAVAAFQDNRVVIGYRAGNDVRLTHKVQGALWSEATTINPTWAVGAGEPRIVVSRAGGAILTVPGYSTNFSFTQVWRSEGGINWEELGALKINYSLEQVHVQPGQCLDEVLFLQPRYSGNPPRLARYIEGESNMQVIKTITSVSPYVLGRAVVTPEGGVVWAYSDNNGAVTQFWAKMWGTTF